MTGVKQADSTATAILERIRSKGPGWVFTPSDFADLGSKSGVHVTLTRLNQEGTIRRLNRGLYESPRHHPKLGTLAPSPDAVARALQSRDAGRLLPTGAHASNLLGLSEQVPARIEYLTDGRPRRVRIGRQEIVLKHRGSRTMAPAGRPSGLLIQALDHLGKDAVSEELLDRIRTRFSPEELQDMIADAGFAPDWIAEVLRRLTRRAVREREQ